MSEPEHALLLRRNPSSKSSKPIGALVLSPSPYNTAALRPQAVLTQVNVLGIITRTCERPRQSSASSFPAARKSDKPPGLQLYSVLLQPQIVIVFVEYSFKLFAELRKVGIGLMISSLISPVRHARASGRTGFLIQLARRSCRQCMV